MDILVLLVRIIIHTVAVYRFSLLLIEDSGPFHALDNLRAQAGISHEVVSEMDENGKLNSVVYTHADGFWAELLSCPYCISGWLAALASINIVKRNKLVDLIVVYGCIWGVVHWTFKRMGY